jgi:AraC-like DNA-binding protein
MSIAVYFIKREEHKLDLKFLIDNMIALSLFSGMALIVVHVFEKHIKKIQAQKDKLAEFLSSEKELSNLLLHQPNSFIQSSSEEEVSFQDRKYAKSGLKADEVKEIIHKLLKYMEEEKPYLNENLKITDLANELKVSKNNLSQAINDGLGKNFYTFLNSYRINEFIHKIKKEEYSDHSILRIAMDCGFNSKSSFNFTFKKITGLSPREFKTRNIDSNQ